jgi:hypothetical protein
LKARKKARNSPELRAFLILGPALHKTFCVNLLWTKNVTTIAKAWAMICGDFAYLGLTVRKQGE